MLPQREALMTASGRPGERVCSRWQGRGRMKDQAPRRLALGPHPVRAQDGVPNRTEPAQALAPQAAPRDSHAHPH